MSERESVCICCKATGHGVEIHMHHVVPTQIMKNDGTVPLCASCHALVHDSRLVAARALSADAIRARSAAGNPVGKAPFGWRWENGRKVEDEREQATLRRCVEILQLDPQATYVRIARRLEQEGYMARDSRPPTAQNVLRWVTRGNIAPLVNGALVNGREDRAGGRRLGMAVRARLIEERQANSEGQP